MAAASGDSKSAARRVELLRDEINDHDHRYYVLNEPAVPDAEYDRLMKELRELETAHPELVTPDSPTQRVAGFAAAEFAAARHAIPMLSLENGFTEQDLADFDRKVRERLTRTESERATRIEYAAEPKLERHLLLRRVADAIFANAQVQIHECPELRSGQMPHQFAEQDR